MVRKIAIFFLLVSMLFCFSACKSSKISEKGIKNEKTKFDETQILFRAQDRCDIEDDRYTLYSYNYKGELLETDDEANIGIYAENGLAPAAHPQSGKVGFVNKEGEFIIEPKYDDASLFSKDGLAPVCIEDEETYREKWGFINSKGEQIVPIIYDDVTSFYDSGYAVIGTYTNEEDMICSYGIVDKKGNVILEPQYREVTYIFDKYFLCMLENSETAIMDFKGNIISKSDGENSYYTICEENYGDIEIYEYKVIRDENGEINNYEYLGTFDGKKFVEEKNDYKISSKNVATTYTGIGYGITKNEKTVIPFEYDYIQRYNSYFVAVKYLSENEFEQTIDIYDKDFNKIAEDLGYTFSNRSSLYGKYCMLPDGYFEIKLEDEDYEWVYGIIDAEGNVIVEPVFGRGIILNTYEGVSKFGRY